MTRSVRVHDDTHRALKALKAKKMNASLDAVIRELIRTSTGVPVERLELPAKPDRLTDFFRE